MKKIIYSKFFFFIILTIVIFCIYGKSINFNISKLDDYELINKTISFISHNITNIPKLFTVDCYLDTSSQYYRPILNTSFAIEHYIFKDNLKIYHITNILLFILSLYCIFLLLHKLKFNDTITKWLIILFSVHPILSSIPVWIPARNDSLLAIFFISSLICFINYINTNKIKYLLSHCLFFILSLYTKETTILLILIYPLTIYCFNLKTTKKQLLNNIYLLIPILISYFILRHFAVKSLNLSLYFTNYLYFTKNMFFGYMIYIEKIFYPTSMPIMLYNIYPSLQTIIVNIIIILLIFFIYYKKIINRKIIFFVSIFYFVSILPTFLQEDYAFLPHRITISLVAILMIFSSFIEKALILNNKLKNYMIIIFLFIFILFSLISFTIINRYKNPFEYWYNAYQDASNYHFVCDRFAKELSDKKYYSKSLDISKEAINLNPQEPSYYMTYARTLFLFNQFNEAENIYFQLLQQKKDDVFLFLNLSELFSYKKDFIKSIYYAKEAIKHSNKYYKLLMKENLSRIYSTNKQYRESLEIVLELIEADKKNDRYYYLASMLNEDLNNYNQALDYIKEAIKLNPKQNYIKQQEKLDQILA